MGKKPKPEDDDWVPSSPPAPTLPYSASSGPKPPAPAGPSLNTTPYTPTLNAVNFPTFTPPADHTANIGGYGPGTPAAHRDRLVNLSQGDQLRLLGEINIRQRRASGTGQSEFWEMPALVVGDDLTSADKRAVRFPVLEMLSPDDTRVDNVGYSYKAFESNLQRQTVASSNLGFGIPQIFRVDASYSDTSAIATHEKTVTIYSQASQLIPKAKVVIDEKQISLDPDFVSQVEKILSPGTGAPKEDITVRLLALLRKYGHFVPLSMMLGGRIILHATTKLSDSSQFEMVKREFKVAADAKLSVEGVPVEGGGGVGVGTEHTNTASATQQFKSLLMVLRGGNESLGDSRESGQLGTKWIASLAPYLEWKTVGFYDNSLVPIIAFLPEKTRDLCERLLRDYFRS